jgi:hypothetical protein
MFMCTWLYIIYHNFFNKNNINAEPFHILFDENNQKYIMININDITNQNLIQTLSGELDKIHYFENNEYIGLNHNTNKESLLVIPYNNLKEITYNVMVTGVLHKIKNKQEQFSLVPFKTVINPGTIKGTIIKNKYINLNNEESITKKDLNNLYLKNMYSYNSIPIYLLVNKINDNHIKVNMKIY